MHTQRDRDLIQVKFSYDRVVDHPLCFYDQNYIQNIKKTYTRKDFCKNFSLDETNTYIGIFGFISQYKGHETLIRAMQFLPPSFNLLIFGAQHPHSIRLEEPINKYINYLIKLVTTMKLTNRVKFFRALNDDDFLKAMINCDFNILPYMEVKQGGSAIAALSLETNSHLFSPKTMHFLS